jgi:hypothetical protein
MLTFSQCFGSRYCMTSISEYTRATRSVGAAKVPQPINANALIRGVLCPMAWKKQPYHPHVPSSYCLCILNVWTLLRRGLTHRLAMIHENSASQALRQSLCFADKLGLWSQSLSSPQEGFLGIQFLRHPAIAINFCNYL